MWHAPVCGLSTYTKLHAPRYKVSTPNNSYDSYYRNPIFGYFGSLGILSRLATRTTLRPAVHLQDWDLPSSSVQNFKDIARLLKEVVCGIYRCLPMLRNQIVVIASSSPHVCTHLSIHPYTDFLSVSTISLSMAVSISIAFYSRVYEEFEFHLGRQVGRTFRLDCQKLKCTLESSRYMKNTYTSGLKICGY